MKTYGLIKTACIPVRTEPNEKSEIATQLLFGDKVFIIEQNGNWSRIASLFDDYVGWIDNKTLIYTSNSNWNYSVLDKLFSWAIDNDGFKTLIPAGASLPNYNFDNNTFTVENITYKLIDPITLYPKTPDSIITLSHQFLNCPYLWGGKTAFGIDCSGLVQVVFKIIGINLLRDAKQQVHHGNTINFLEEAHPADLLFFDNNEGQITHVGIYLGNNKIIHASGIVRIDYVDNYGIFRQDIQKYTHKLRTIKRILT